MKLQEVFETTVIDNFDATVEAVDFRNDIPHAVNIINQFVEAKTRGKIQNIVEEQTFKEDSEIVLILVSALYFKADWARRFQRGCMFPPHVQRDKRHSMRGYVHEADGMQFSSMVFRGNWKVPKFSNCRLKTFRAAPFSFCPKILTM